jgi:ribosomal-protein-alanine N-acetyltransferase
MEIVQIEEADRNDIDGIYQVDKRAFEYPMSRASIERDLRDERLSKYFVARALGVIVGYVGIWCVYPEAHIVSIAVDPDFQGKGIGTRLMETGLQWLMDNGFKDVFLEVRVDNDVAIRLYTKFGFKKVTIRKNYYQDGSDAYVMLRDLTKPIANEGDSYE